MDEVKNPRRSPKAEWSAKDILMSRKLMLAHCSLTLIFVGAVLASKYSWSESLFSNFVNGIMGIAGIYTTGNVGSKWVVTKNDKPQDNPVKD
jgi:hypothetical protein